MRARDALEMMKEGAESVGKHMKRPTDDWAPVMLVCPAEEDPYFMEWDPRVFLASEEAKTMWVAAMETVLQKSKATAVALVSSTWMALVDVPEELRGNPIGAIAAREAAEHMPRPSEHPDRIEAVLIVALDAEEALGATAKIQRRERKPPLLLPWDDAPSFMDGRIMDALRRGLTRPAAHR